MCFRLCVRVRFLRIFCRPHHVQCWHKTQLSAIKTNSYYCRRPKIFKPLPFHGDAFLSYMCCTMSWHGKPRANSSTGVSSLASWLAHFTVATMRSTSWVGFTVLLVETSVTTAMLSRLSSATFLPSLSCPSQRTESNTQVSNIVSTPLWVMIIQENQPYGVFSHESEIL